MRELKPSEYCCALCHNVCNKGLTDKEAWEETQQYWPNAKQENCDVVCDDCWQKIKPEDYPDECFDGTMDSHPITEKHIAQIFGLDLDDPETKTIWDEAGRIMERFRETQKILTDTWKHLQPALIRIERLLRPYCIVTPGLSSRKPKRRSKRGVVVQEKRKKLGLDVNGRLPGAWGKLPRKEAYARAQEKVNILVLCQGCNEWFLMRVRRVETNNYWYRLHHAISCPNCQIQHEAGRQLWWRWKDK